MAKWADYLISQVSYDPNHLITKVKQHRDNGSTISEGEVVDRSVIADNLGHGNRYMTVYSDLGKIRIGKNVRYFRAYEHHYIRIDNNRVSSDNLGDLPQPDESKREEKPALTETKPIPAVETKPLSALSSAFFAEQVEEEPEPAAVEADVTPEPSKVEVEVTPEPAKVEVEVTPEPAKVEVEVTPKKTKKKVVKIKSSAKKKPARVEVKVTPKKTKKKVVKIKSSAKKKPAKVEVKVTPELKPDIKKGRKKYEKEYLTRYRKQQKAKKKSAKKRS